ncbi:MAG: hypothetical protein J6U54_09395 [Clostridiales bacterium]|nr:hypothetical protein [Clostridiales bacterium]
MKRNLFKITTTVLIASIAMSSCTSKKTDIKVRHKEDAEITEETATTEPTATETTATPEPTVQVTTTNAYSDADAPIVVNWDNYQKAADPKDSYLYTRMSDDYISEFTPSGDYGRIFPYLATSTPVHSTYGEEDYIDEYVDNYERSYGLCDENGTIICDPIFSSASKSYLMDFYILGKGQRPNKKIGLANTEGSKFTGLIYEYVDCDSIDRLIFARGDGELTVLDEDLNVILKKPYKLNFNTLDYVDDEYDLGFSQMIDDTHYVIGLGQGETTVLDITTGNFTDTFQSVGSDFLVRWDNGNVYMADSDGNPKSDIYDDFVWGSGIPIFGNDGYYYGLDLEGNVIKELGKCNAPQRRSAGDYTFFSPDGKKFTLYDKDFNEYGEYTDEQILNAYTWNENWENLNKPYVLVDGKVIDPLTDEVLMEGVTGSGYCYFYLGKDMCAVKIDTKYTLSNGKTFTISQEYNSTLLFDEEQDKYYITDCRNDALILYSVEDDRTYIIEDIHDYYSSFIADNKLYYRAGDDSTIYDISDLNNIQPIFHYVATDPMGD